MEHVALNVSDPVAMAAWYKEHLGFEIAKGMTTPSLHHLSKGELGRYDDRDLL